MEAKSIELNVPEGVSPERFLEEQRQAAKGKPELKVLGPRSAKLAGEIEKLRAAREEQAAQAERLAETLEGYLTELGMLRAGEFLGKTNREQVATVEEKAAALQGDLAKAKSVIAGVDRLLQERKGALPTAQLEDLEAAIAGNGKALAKVKKAFLGLLEAAAGDLQAAGLYEQRAKWQELVDKRLGLLEALYHPDRVGGSDGRAGRQIRLELVNDYGLFSPDVAEPILALATCLLDLYECKSGRPAVR